MSPIPQLRWNILMDSQEEYDCSMGGNSTTDWSTKGTPRPYFGALCLLFALLTIPMYFLSAKIIWTMRRGSTYKIMFVLALADITTLFVNSVTFGIFLSVGNRTWRLLIVSLIYPFLLASFTPLFFFNSEYHIATVNPGIYEDHRYEYYNVAHMFNNFCLPTLSFLVYIFMLVYILFKKKKTAVQAHASVNRAAAMLSIQSGIIVVVHFTTGITYEITQYIPPSDGILYIAQLAWMLEHGLPPLIYIIFNQSVREGVRQYTAPSSFRKTTIQPSHAPTPQAPSII